jgi:glycosyltransferase involved in cell wall biosynthesis
MPKDNRYLHYQRTLDDFLSGKKNNSLQKNESLFPKISIVTPSFNQGIFLEKTILSVLNQEYPNLEYIIIDGGSTDKSINIIKKYEKYLTYWHSKHDRGQSDAIAQGFKRATGSILAWLNSDDIFYPNALNHIGCFFMENSKIDVIYGDSLRIDKDNRVTNEIYSVPFSKLGFISQAFYFHQASVFWRKTIYDRSNGINTSLHLTMDPDLWLRFYNARAKFCYLPKILSCCRSHSETKTNQNFEKIQQLRKRLVQTHLGINPVSFRYRFLRRLMRIRTLLYHLKNRRFYYLFNDVLKCRLQST